MASPLSRPVCRVPQFAFISCFPFAPCVFVSLLLDLVYIFVILPSSFLDDVCLFLALSPNPDSWSFSLTEGTFKYFITSICSKAECLIFQESNTEGHFSTKHANYVSLQKRRQRPKGLIIIIKIIVMNFI